MAANRGVVGWIVMAILLLVAVAVGWSIWSSLRDTRAKLAAQAEKMAELQRQDAALRSHIDSLNVVLTQLEERDSVLTAERRALRDQLERERAAFNRRLAQLNNLWEAKDILTELDGAFPHWAGRFWAAKTPNGLEGMIAPRFFSAEVLEIVAERDSLQNEAVQQGRIVNNLENAVAVKDSSLQIVVSQRDSLQVTYDRLFDEYGILDKKYRKEVASRWFKLTPGNILSFGVGAGAGVLVGRASK